MFLLSGRPGENTGPRRLYVRKEVEIEKYGTTPDCPGCIAILRGVRAQAHSEACRRRIEGRMREDDDLSKRRLEEARMRVEKRPGESLESEEKRDRKAEPLERSEEGTQASASSGSAQAAPLGDAVPATPAAAVAEEVVPMHEEPLGQGERRKPSHQLTPSEGGEEGVGYINKVLFELGGLPIGSRADIGEVFCKDRFSAVCQKHGLHSGFAIDLTTGWDLDKDDHKKAARDLVRRARPLFIIGSPECTAFSTLLNFGTIKEDKYKELVSKGMDHLNQCIGMYESEIQQGRYFIHEHPHSAWSWKVKRMRDLADRPGITYVRMDQCEAGQTAKTVDGRELPAQKPTGWLTNSPEVAKQLARFQCRNRRQGWDQHEHAHLISGKAKGAECYPPRLVHATLLDIKKQIESDQQKEIGSIDVGYNIEEEVGHGSAFMDEQAEEFFDEISGAKLPPELVRKAIQDEIDFLRDIVVYKKVPESQAVGKEKV